MIAKYKIPLLLVILALIAFGAWKIGISHVKDKDFTIALLNGFWTAFFALIFAGPSVILSKITTRERQHYNSLVLLAAQLNEMIGIIRDNLYVMEGVKRNIVRGNINWSSFNMITIDRSHLENLYDLDLINEVFTFFYDIRKINNDLSNVQNGYADLKNAYIQKQVSVRQYVANSNLIVKELSVLEKFLEETEEDLVKLYARLRIQMEKDKPFTTKILEKLVYTAGPTITVKEMDKEITTIKAELEESGKKSRKKIEKIVKAKK